MWHSSCSSTTLDVLLYCSLSFPEQIYLGYWWWYLDADAHHQYIYVKIVWYHTQWYESRIIRLEIVGVHLNLFCTLHKWWLQVLEIFLIPGLVHLKKTSKLMQQMTALLHQLVTKTQMRIDQFVCLLMWEVAGFCL